MMKVNQEYVLQKETDVSPKCCFHTLTKRAADRTARIVWSTCETLAKLVVTLSDAVDAGDVSVTSVVAVAAGVDVI